MKIANLQVNHLQFQRFGSDFVFPLARQHMNGVAGNVQRAAEIYGRKVFIQYDLSNWTNFTRELIPDLTTNMTILTASPAYARHNGKRVICIWGMGFGEPGGNRPNNPTGTLNLINQLKALGYYVIGGVPHTWRTNEGISIPAYASVYRSCDMIQPWTVGTFTNIPTALAYKTRQQGDLQSAIVLASVISRLFGPALHGQIGWQTHPEMQFLDKTEHSCGNNFETAEH